MTDHGRDRKLDVARGLAITAIVVGHVGRGLIDAGTLSIAEYAPWDRALYMSHLTVFVLVSGLLTPGGVRRHGARSFAFTRVRLFLYLYVLWSVLQGAIRVVMADATNTQMTWMNVFQLWVPRGQMWFLPFVAASTALVVVTQPWRSGRRWIVSVAVAASLLLWGNEGDWAFTQGWPLVGALFVGALVGTGGMASLEAFLRPPALGLLVVSALAVYLLLLATPAAPPTYQSSDWSILKASLGAAASATGVVFVLALSATLAPTRVGAGIALLGRNSLAIFLAHIVAASGTRVALNAAGVEDATVHLVLGSAAGIVLPLVLVVVARRPILTWLFDDKPMVSTFSALTAAGSEERR